MRPQPEAIPRVAPKARLQWDEVGSRHVLLYPEGLVALNPTGAAILELCDGARPIAQIADELERRYSRPGLLDDVVEFLDRLAQKGLVTYAAT